MQMINQIFGIVFALMLSALAGVAQIPAATQHSTALAWAPAATQPAGITVAGYNAYRAALAGGPYTKLNTTLITVTSFNDTTVSPATTYFYCVETVDTSGNVSGCGPSASDAIPNNPNIPTALIATPHSGEKPKKSLLRRFFSWLL